jgi:hypothetical protein
MLLKVMGMGVFTLPYVGPENGVEMMISLSATLQIDVLHVHLIPTFILPKP